ncbi:MAG: hypothetical protein WCG04_05800 [Alphaproteobacteria bacterium]
MKKLDIQEKHQIGERFRLARAAVPLSRTMFCKKHGISYHTMQSWELARHASRLKNVARFCEALAEEGVFCTESWLLEGVGIGPLTVSGLPKPQVESLTLITKEMAFFQELHQQAGINTVVMRVDDDAMHPDYRMGDYVGARYLEADHEEQFYNQVCLIEVEPQNYLLRQLLKEKERYLLHAHRSTDYPLIVLDKVFGFAEILIRRRPFETVLRASGRTEKPCPVRPEVARSTVSKG